MAVMTPLASRFGQAFRQRCSEAIGCYRSGHYLAACVMAGAAAESIIVAAQIAHTKNAAAVMKRLPNPGRVLGDLFNRTPDPLKSQIRVLSDVIGYWRNDAAHAVPTTISEPEASHALGQLMRMAMLVDQRWGELT